MIPFGSYLTEVAINNVRAEMIIIEHRVTAENRVSVIVGDDKRKVVATMRMITGMNGLIEIFESAFIMESHLLEAMKSDNSFTSQSSKLDTALKFASAELSESDRTSHIDNVMQMAQISLNVYAASQKFVNDASPVFMNRVHEVLGHLKFQIEFLNFLNDAYARVLDADLMKLSEQLMKIVQSSSIWNWNK